MYLQDELLLAAPLADGAHLFVTSGVQGWGPPVRTVGASEILVLRLTFRKPA